MIDAQRHEKSHQGGGLARLDPVEQILRRLISKTVEGKELLLRQVIEIGRVLDQLPVDQLLQRGVAEALDVERGDEMSQVLEDLCRTDGIDTASGRFTGLADEVRAAFRAFLRHPPGPARRRALLREDPNHLRDHVTGPLDDDVVPRPDVLARHLVLVVQGGAADGDTADLDGREPGHRGNRASAADVNLDLLDDRFGLLRRKLEGERPTRTA